MDISEYTKQTGTFLKAEDVIKDPTAIWEITAEGEIVVNKFGNQRLHLPVKNGDDNRIFDCAKTNAQFIEKILNTANTSNWKGKHLLLGTYRTSTSDGKKVDALEVKEVK